MTKNNTTLSAFVDSLMEEHHLSEFYDTFEEEGKIPSEIIPGMVMDLLDYVGVNEENYCQFIKDRVDFWNGSNEDGHYFCDLSSEWANSHVDIYHYDLWDTIVRRLII